MKTRLYLLTFVLVAVVIIGFGYAGMTLSLNYMQQKYIELQLDINKRQAENMAAFLENQLKNGSSKQEVRDNLQTALVGSDAEKGFLCMFDKYDAEMICHPDENQIGMKLPASMSFENAETGETDKTRNVILEGLATGGLFHKENGTDIAYMVPVKGTGWMISAHENIENIRAEIMSQKEMFLLGFLVISIVSAIVATLMARLVGRRYEKKIEEQNILLENTNEELNTTNNELHAKHKEISLQKKVIEDQHEQVKEKNEELKSINEELTQKNHEINLQKTIIEDQHDHVKKQNEQISEQNEQIKSSILYARRIQEALLPPNSQIQEVINEHFIIFKPKDIVSGDFYWFKKINNNIVFAAADSTGHGVPGAFMSMLGIAFMNEIVTEDFHSSASCSASTILDDLREKVKNTLHQTGEDDQTKDGMDMALILLNTENLVMQFAGAYNPLYIVRNNKLTEVPADKMPVGVYLKDSETFTNKKAQLQKGDILYMFSDGYYDQFGGDNGRKFMKKRFRELLEEVSDKNMNEQKQVLENTLAEWQGKHEQADDILVIGIKI
ncbi:MAG: SpoIIE family protein phosphatase [Bacteroidales bacterium]|nr:SpoIIE family protein phosphatase [Bacteroidales bacterium]